MTKSTLVRARVPAARLAKTEKILRKLGLKPGEAINLFLAQVELRQGLPFAVSAAPQPLLDSAQQAQNWNDALGQY